MIKFLRRFFGPRREVKKETGENTQTSVPSYTVYDAYSDLIDMWMWENEQRVKNGEPTIPLFPEAKPLVLECNKVHCGMRIS